MCELSGWELESSGGGGRTTCKPESEDASLPSGRGWTEGRDGPGREGRAERHAQLLPPYIDYFYGYVVARNVTISQHPTNVDGKDMTHDMSMHEHNMDPREVG